MVDSFLVVVGVGLELGGVGSESFRRYRTGYRPDAGRDRRIDGTALAS